MAALAALVLTTASAAAAPNEVEGGQVTAVRAVYGDHSFLPPGERGYDGRGCTNYFQYLYDSNNC